MVLTLRYPWHSAQKLRTPDLLVKVNSTLSHTASTLLHRLVLLSVCFIYPMSGRYSTNWDQKRWPGSEIQMYFGCPWNSLFLLSGAYTGIYLVWGGVETLESLYSLINGGLSPSPLLFTPLQIIHNYNILSETKQKKTREGGAG